MKRFLVALLVCFSGIAGAADPKKPYGGYVVKVTKSMVNAHKVRSISAVEVSGVTRNFSFSCNETADSCSTPSLDDTYRLDVPSKRLYTCDNYMLCRVSDSHCINVCLDSVY
jgi:hypothetical protein